MWEIKPNSNTSITIYPYKYRTSPIGELLEETRGGRKEEENDKVKNIEIHHICVEIRHKKTH
jgi:hypothetical protein